MKNIKIIVARFFLIILIILLIALNYVKFFMNSNDNIQQTPVENSASQAVNTALNQIVENFNADEKIKEFQTNNIEITAVLNNYSIFINYKGETSTTYEFHYNNFKLDIKVSNDEENMEKFKIIYEILIRAVQKRLNNTENIDTYINEFLTDSMEYDGLQKIATDDSDIFMYTMDITKKIENNNLEDTVTENLEDTVTE